MVLLNAERFDYELKRRALTAEDLSHLSGVSVVTLSRLRRGHVQPRVETLRRIYDTLAEVPVRKDLDKALRSPEQVA